MGDGSGKLELPSRSVFQKGDSIGLDPLTSRTLDMLQSHCPNLKKLRLGCESIIFAEMHVHAH